MDFYSVLNISEGADLKEIKRAYARLLPLHSPEHDRDGFQRLRTAYEAAIKHVTEQSSSEERNTDQGEAAAVGPITTVEQFMERVKAIYNDYSLRTDTGVWEQLLSEDICHHLDTRGEISEQLLGFLTDYYFLPQSVWAAMNEHFEWSGQRTALVQRFNTNFVDYLFRRIDRDDFFRYELLIGLSADQADAFIRAIHTGSNALEAFDYYGAYGAIEEAKAVRLEHPDLLILMARYLMAIGRLEEAQSLLDAQIEKDTSNFYMRYYRGNLHYRLGQYEAAMELFEQILPVRPDMVDILFSLGKCGVSLGAYDKAIEYLNRLRKILPQDSEVQWLLQSAYQFQIGLLQKELAENEDDESKSMLLATAYLETGRNEECYELLVRMEHKHRSARLYDMLSSVLYRLGKPELAQQTLTEAIRQFPDDFELNLFYGGHMDDIGQVEEAIHYYEKAEALQPDHATLLNNKAFSLNRLGRYEEALVYSIRVSAIEPSMPNGYRTKAEALLGLNRLEESYEACEEALRLNPQYAHAYVTKMKILTSARQLGDVHGVYQKAQEQGLQDVRLQGAMAEALRLGGNYEEAIAMCEQALETDGSRSDIRYTLAQSYFHLNRYEEACASFDDVIAANGSEDARYYRGLSLYYSDKEEAALQEARHAITLDIGNKDQFHDLMGDIYRHWDQRDNAVREYRMAVAYNPNRAIYHCQIGELLRGSLDTMEECFEALNAALELDPSMVRAYESKIHATFFVTEDYSSCLDLCNTVLELEPEHMFAIDFKAWALFKLGNMEEAQRIVQEGLLLDGKFVSLLHLKAVLLRENGLTREALVVCDRILEIDPEHKETNEIIESLQPQEPEKEEKGGRSLFRRLISK